MLRKTFQLLKNNPSILFFQLVFITGSFLSSFLFCSVRQSEISNNSEYFLYCSKFLFSTVLGLLLDMIFIAGFGNTVSKAITTGKSGYATFFMGLKKNFVKSILSVLLLYINYGVFSSILFPVAAQIIADIFIPYGDFRNVFYYICIYIISIFIMPFTSLFLPAVFIDNDDILVSFIMSIKLTIKNYKKLIWALSAMYIPIIINIIFIKDSVMFVFTPLPSEYILNAVDIISGNVFSASVIIMYFLEAAISLVLTPLFFVIYDESSSKRLLY